MSRSDMTMRVLVTLLVGFAVRAAIAATDPSITLADGASAELALSADTKHVSGLGYRCQGDATLTITNDTGVKSGTLFRLLEARHGTLTVDVSQCALTNFTFAGGAVSDKDGKIVLKASSALRRVTFGSSYTSSPRPYSLANFEVRVGGSLVTNGLDVVFDRTFALMATPTNYPQWTVATGSSIHLADANQSSNAWPTGPGDLLAKYYDADGVLDLGPSGLNCNVVILAPNALTAGKTLRTGGGRTVRFFLCYFSDWWSLSGLKAGVKNRADPRMRIAFDIDLASSDCRLQTGDSNCLHLDGDITGPGRVEFSNGEMKKADINWIYFNGRYAVTGPVSCSRYGWGRLCFTNPAGYLGDAATAGSCVTLTNEVGLVYQLAGDGPYPVSLARLAAADTCTNVVLSVGGNVALSVGELEGAFKVDCAVGGSLTVRDDTWKTSLDDTILGWFDASAPQAVTNLLAQKDEGVFKVGDPVTYVTPAPESLTVYATGAWNDCRPGRTAQFVNDVWKNTSSAYWLPSYAYIYPHLVPKGLNRRAYLSMNSSGTCRYHRMSMPGTPKYAMMVFGSQHGGGAGILGDTKAGAFCRDKSSAYNPIVTNQTYRTGRFWVDGRAVDPTDVGFSGGWQTIAVDLAGAAVTGIGFGGVATGSKSDAGKQNYAELLFFDRLLTAWERTRVERYLVEKWGLGATYHDEGPRASLTLTGGGAVDLHTPATVDASGFAGRVTQHYNPMPRQRSGFLFSLIGQPADPLMPLIDHTIGNSVFTGVKRVPTDETSGMSVALENNILYSGVGHTLYVYDVSSPFDPVLLGSCGPLGAIRQLACEDGMVYLSARETGMWIVNAKDPAHPFRESRFDAIELGTGMSVCSNVVFLGLRNYGVEFVDVSNPKVPKHIRIEKTSESQSTCYRDGICYSGDWGQGEATVIDAADMSAVSTVRVVKLHGYGDGVDVYGDRLYVSTGHHYRYQTASGSWTTDDEEGYGKGHALEIMDLTDPRNPVPLGRCAFATFYRTGMDMWMPRASAEGRYVFCADTYNGLYAVDTLDPAMPKIVGRITAPSPSDASGTSPVTGVAVGNGVVYFTSSGRGLAVARCPVARARPLARSTPPANVGYRASYAQEQQYLRTAWTPTSVGQVHSAAALGDDYVYVAAGHGGLAVLDRDLAEVARSDIPFCGDVKVRDGQLFSAEGVEGFVRYDLSDPLKPREVERVTAFGSALGSNCPIWLSAPTGSTYVVLSEHGSSTSIYNPAYSANWTKRLATISGAPGWDKYMADEAVNGYLAANARGNVSWFDVTGSKPVKTVVSDFASSGGLNVGICAFSRGRFLTMNGGRVVYAVPGTEDASTWTMSAKLSGVSDGQPVWDGATSVGVCERARRRVSKLNVSNEANPTVVWSETTSGYPERAIFFRGKLLVPCGYQGLLVEK